MEEVVEGLKKEVELEEEERRRMRKSWGGAGLRHRSRPWRPLWACPPEGGTGPAPHTGEWCLPPKVDAGGHPLMKEVEEAAPWGASWAAAGKKCWPTPRVSSGNSPITASGAWPVLAVPEGAQSPRREPPCASCARPAADSAMSYKLLSVVQSPLRRDSKPARPRRRGTKGLVCTTR